MQLKLNNIILHSLAFNTEGELKCYPRNEELANSPNPQTTDVDTQLNKQSGGLNGPKDKSALKGNSFPLHDNKEVHEGLLDAYKEYKGE